MENMVVLPFASRPLTWPRLGQSFAKREQTPPISGRGFNRDAAETAIVRAKAKLGSMVFRDCPNGAILFCSEDIVEHWLPPTPLKGTKYWCDTGFDLTELWKAFNAQKANTYGIIAIDGSEASLGEVQVVEQGRIVKKLAHIRPSQPIPSETRRGGSSAGRYMRLREEARLSFLRRVAEKVAPLFDNSHGLIMAGQADMKHRLIEELPRPLRSRVLCVVDLPCAAGAEDALHKAAERAQDSMKTNAHCQAEEAVSQFLQLARSDPDLCCYGEEQTRAALEMGAGIVEQLFVASSLDVNFWKALAEVQGAIAIEVHPRGEETVEFCRAFGVAGRLRWRIDDIESLESIMPSAEHIVDASIAMYLEATALGMDLATKSVVVGEGHDIRDTAHASSFELPSQAETLCWLKEELSTSLEDTCGTEALIAGVEVILSIEDEQDDALGQALEMLRGEGISENILVEFALRWGAVQ